MDFTGKVALVTGGGNGIGRATSVAFARYGAKVVVVDRDGAGAEATAGIIRQNGGEATAVTADVTRSEDVKAYVKAALTTYGRIDCFFNNAGIEGRLAPTAEYDEAVFDAVIGVNVKGVFLGLRHVLPEMIRQGSGAVVNTASVAGLVGWGGTVYGATKGAVIQLTRGVAIEVAPFGIRVNAICPAAMPLTGFMAAGGLKVDAEQQAAIAESVGGQHPLGRAIMAEDCAEAALYLVSDASRNVTGVALPVDGGFVAR